MILFNWGAGDFYLTEEQDDFYLTEDKDDFI